MADTQQLQAPALTGAATDGTNGIPTVPQFQGATQPVNTPIGPTGLAASGAQRQVTPARPVNTGAYDALKAAGQAGLDAQTKQRDTTILQSAESAWENTDTYSLLYQNKPSFTPQSNFNPKASMDAVPFPLDDSQRKFLGEAVSPDDFSWRLDQTKAQNERSAAMSAHPWVSGAILMADPVYLAADLLSAGAAAAVTSSRVVRGLAAASSQLAVLNQADAYRYVSPSEMVWNAALAGAGGMVFPGGVKSDPVAKAVQLAQEEADRVKFFNAQRMGQMDLKDWIEQNRVNDAHDVLTGKAPAWATPQQNAEAMLQQMNPKAYEAFKAQQQAVTMPGTQPVGVSINGAMAGYLSGAVPQSADQAAAAAVSTMTAKPPSKTQQLMQKIARGVSFSRYNELSKHSQSLADRLLADPLNPTTTNAGVIFAEQEGRTGRLLGHAEDLMNDYMIQDGWTAKSRIGDSQGWVNAQRTLESKVQRELEARTADNNFRGADERVNAIADRYGQFSQAVAKDLEDVGLVEPGFAKQNPYYYARRWDGDKVFAAEQQIGADALRDGLSAAIRSKSQGTSKEMADEIAGALVRRAKDKRLGLGLGMDRGTGLLEEALDELKVTGGSADTIAALQGELTRDTGPTSLRRRVDLDTTYELAPGLQVHDLFNANVLGSMRGYHRRMAGQIALERVGFGKPSERANALKELAESIPDKHKRSQAVEALQSAFDFYTGEGRMRDSANLRDWRAYNSGVSLVMSGFGQMIEFGTTMAEHGAVATMKGLLRTSPEARALVKGVNADPALAKSVTRVLSESVANSVTLRMALTDIEREPGFIGNNIGRVLEQANDARQAYALEGFFRSRQTALNAGMAWEGIRGAAAGDAKALKKMVRFGMTEDLAKRVQAEIAKHGDDIDSYDYATRRDVGAVTINATRTAMSEGLFGSVPSFFDDKLGAFLGTFMRFVFSAHNGVTARTLNQRGVGGLALILAYQFPLAMLQQYARDALSGKGVRAPEEVAANAMGQMSGLGILSEAVGIVGDGGKGIGGSGINGARKLLYPVQHAAQALAPGEHSSSGVELSKSLGGIMAAVPVIGAIPGVRVLSSAMQDAKPQ